MGFFEDELRKMFWKNLPITDARFTGRVCVGRLTEKINVKLSFETFGTYGRYEGVRATVFNRSGGEIDSNLFRFVDILGQKVCGNTKNDPPYILGTSDEGPKWYFIRPDEADYAAVAKAVSIYLGVFMEPKRPKARRIYLLYPCGKGHGKSKASPLLATADRETLYAAIGGAILTGSMEYGGKTGGTGFDGYKWDYLTSDVEMGKLNYGFVKEIDEARLSEPETLPEYCKEVWDFLDVDFDFDAAEFDRANSSGDGHGGFEPEGESDMEI